MICLYVDQSQVWMIQSKFGETSNAGVFVRFIFIIHHTYIGSVKNSFDSPGDFIDLVLFIKPNLKIWIFHYHQYLSFVFEKVLSWDPSIRKRPNLMSIFRNIMFDVRIRLIVMSLKPSIQIVTKVKFFFNYHLPNLFKESRYEK